MPTTPSPSAPACWLGVLLTCGLLGPGCTRMGFATVDQPPGGPDAKVGLDRGLIGPEVGVGLDGTATADVLVVGQVRCDDWREGSFEFGAPELVAEASHATLDEEQPQLSYDGLRMTFGRGLDIYQVTRATSSAPFTAASPVAGLATALSEPGAFISEDQLVAYVMTNAAGGLGGLDIWRYTRASTAEPFAETRNVTELNTPRHDWDPFVTFDGRRIYGARVLSDDLYQIWYADHLGGGVFSTPEVITALDTMPFKGNPSLTFDERVIVFNARPPQGVGSRLFYATRSDREAPFGAPLPLPTADQDEASEPFVTADGCAVYFARQPAPERDDDDLYVARYRGL